MTDSKYPQDMINFIVECRRMLRPFKEITAEIRRRWPEYKQIPVHRVYAIFDRQVRNNPNIAPVQVSLAGPTWSRPGHPDYERRKETA